MLLLAITASTGAVAVVVAWKSAHANATTDKTIESISPAMRAWFGPTIANAGKAPESAPDGMVWIPGGEFSMGAQVERNANDVGMRRTTIRSWRARAA